MSSLSTEFSPGQTVKKSGVENIPAEKLEQMKAYARKLRSKFPHMKPARIQRKVAEYFKIELV